MSKTSLQYTARGWKRATTTEKERRESNLADSFIIVVFYFLLLTKGTYSTSAVAFLGLFCFAQALINSISERMLEVI